VLRLFLSYASQDVDRARRFAADLRRPGIEPWMDDELKLAGRWNDEIEDRIGACDLFLVLLSRATQDGDANRFFRREWSLAYKARRRFFPVRLEECRLPPLLQKTLVTAIESRQREDLFPSYEDSLRRILRFLHAEKRTGVFEETFSCLGPDNAGWQLDTWRLDAAADSTGENSGSIHAAARLSPTALLPQAASHTATIDVDLPGQSLLLRYRRRLRLAAPVGGEARFRVAVDGEVVDTASQADPAEDEWRTRSVAIPDRGARRVRLEVTVTASCALNYFPSAEAWVDDVRIA
jgi:TIR domain